MDNESGGIMKNIYRLAPQLSFNYEELVLDNFAGGGGASTGIELALGRSVDKTLLRVRMGY